ncbi:MULTISPECIES: bacteriophage abortive infection AbiH family protein [unclassified Rhizobium]|uniref:bacteriophage abortive infection AbiH family protein n=1 Tax=unclassified Rhizobium TaxID=2613769 RepID=UPI001ADC6A86|nr:MULTISPECIES: bacteriophage abortive infection AbiH family protein [unclassified Rhizobium]MBO9101291.1 bacteriophage abortive infection AbiH family protein [Rhizobium sp. L58/93]MBO9182745.1 bacteriophage abortive infection AbiH family protein [Rhizobium sp. E27B/91]QXZ86413.1 bacteriophage abortive infection AbiH family protein [Rhizobium sp. K1/93]QXZ92132.1 bacteriophage abortive infection AbiH family protein [Rhizobium sp. K15/93]
MGKTLYIIGNGFDLHHGIPSSYRAFGEYLRRSDAKAYDVVEKYFAMDAQFWAEFEDRLASFDSDSLIEDASNFLVGYGAEDWSDAYHHDYQYEIQQAVEAVSTTLRLRFAEWIRQLPVPWTPEFSGQRVPMDPSAVFLNFNYTPSLQRLYAVPDINVLHIHGSAADPTETLVLGHGWEPVPNLDPYRFEQDPEGADMRVVEGQGIVDDYFRDTFKPTAKVIVKNAAFFAGLSDVDRIVVMGHSVSEVDHPYFEEVIANIDVNLVRWKVSYYGDLDGLRKRMEALGVPAHLTEYALLDAF